MMSTTSVKDTSIDLLGMLTRTENTPTQTHSSLSGTAQLMANALDLQPSSENPGYWNTDNEFISVDGGVLKQGFRDVHAPLQVLVSFFGEDIQEEVRKRLAEEVAQESTEPGQKTRNHGFRLLEIGKRLRSKHVGEIIRDLEEAGIDISSKTITVHRVCNSFSMSVTLDTLHKINKYANAGWQRLRRIKVVGVER